MYNFNVKNYSCCYFLNQTKSIWKLPYLSFPSWGLKNIVLQNTKRKNHIKRKKLDVVRPMDNKPLKESMMITTHYLKSYFNTPLFDSVVATLY